ncbi:hypothetical protein G4H71_01225 [Rhodococcus triatomae]|uniref:SPOR domain-containing protein n=1 Tax=Rhodococcus triatomae TaxID=300028 RepID=A0A1G8DAN1_9NOCA|nr:hypothetical protein [Rhodococcus triatomae]QNG18465.1 hypothetical protein G4H72_06825 [Rhodococcus triatomae]QNG21866.1 hypothetical protein G4H71_01225 [Rhodococcus triatomae]SDH54725.1 hypothetical protein SAMN05444695_102250 [Rhodococcus triatomae]
MTDDDKLWYYDLENGTVAQGKQTSTFTRMGPYPDRESAEHALQIAAERTKEADRVDEEWNE